MRIRKFDNFGDLKRYICDNKNYCANSCYECIYKFLEKTLREITILHMKENNDENKN